MASGQTWHGRFKQNVVRLWRSEDSRVAAVRDVAVAALVVLTLLGVIWAYTGQSFPSQAPLVVVESGSMMHGPHGPCLGGQNCADFGNPPLGRIGTIDPGDLVLVKKVRTFDDIDTAFGSGARSGYGAHGDVIVFKDPLRADPTPVIHRAMLLIHAEPEGCSPGGPTNACRYVIPETCTADRFAEFVQPRSGMSDWRTYCGGSSEPITLDLERDGVFLSLTNYPCVGQACPAFHSGIITKGDNNQQHDQQVPYPGQVGVRGAITCCPIQEDWIVGKARGEIPWFGLVKLAIYGNQRYGCLDNQPCSDPTRGAQWTIIRATAPYDIWLGLFAAVGLLIALPIAFDHGIAFVRRKWGGGRGGNGPPMPPRQP